MFIEKRLAVLCSFALCRNGIGSKTKASQVCQQFNPNCEFNFEVGNATRTTFVTENEAFTGWSSQDQPGAHMMAPFLPHHHPPPATEGVK